jgi:hypothetical protein
MTVIDKPLVFERDDLLYLVGPVSPFRPSETDVDELAWGGDLRKMAPNEHLLWLHGRYVEAERPNANGALWSTRELAIASVTPRLMPITVMHDPSTAVGMIADARLLTPQKDQVERARIDTTLAVWSHRFPQVAHEIAANYEQGGLMQSMECRPGYYDCGVCEARFPNLGGRERANWCEHLRGEVAADGPPVRRLGAVTFTGTGLIYGTRGARGAYSEADLDVLAEEVAEYHERARSGSKPKRSTRTMEVDDKRYQELVAAEAKAKELEPKLATAEEGAAKVPDLERKVDKLEIDKKAAEDDRDAEKAKRERLEEAGRATELASERVGKLGAGFLAKLPESVKTRLVDEQAKKLSDEDWTARLDEIADMVGVKPDEGKSTTDDDDDVLSRDELAASATGNGGDKTHTRELQRAVIGGLHKVLPKS